MPRIALLSTSDTDLLSARASAADYRWANPAKVSLDRAGRDRRRSATWSSLRILGSPGLDPHRAGRGPGTGRPLVVLGGEQLPDAALMALSTVPIGMAAEAHLYLAQGGPANLRQLHAFLSDTVLLTGEGFDPPAASRPGARCRGPAAAGPRAGPRIGILFYRAQHAAGNTAFVHALADAIDAAGGVGVPIFAASLRDAPADLLDQLGTLRRLDRHRARRRRHQAGHRDGRRRRRGLGRTRPGRPGHPDPARPVPDLGPGVLGRLATRA